MVELFILTGVFVVEIMANIELNGLFVKGVINHNYDYKLHGVFGVRKIGCQKVWEIVGTSSKFY